LERKLQRVKQEARGHPECPKTFDDLANIPDKFKLTYHEKPFLIANVKTPAGWIIIYGSKEGLKMMSRGEIWTMDGTFSVVPKPFTQLYSFMSEIEGYSYPCIFCLLPDKKGPSYKIVMETL